MMAEKRFSHTFSASKAEVDRLDAWAHHHNMSRSEAVRAFILAVKIDGQTALNDFEDVQPHPEAEEAVDVASRRPVTAHRPSKGLGIVAKASGRVCYDQPSDLLGGRCIGGKATLVKSREGLFKSPNSDPNSAACPICWPEGMTASATRKEARHALARQRADEAAEMLKEDEE